MKEKIEAELDKIEHYKNIPVMKPFIGENYFDARQKILVIGESHFFDHYPANENPECNPGAKIWYSYSKQIGPEKLEFINTREIVKTTKHPFFKNLKAILSQSLGENESEVMAKIAFMNAFQRPANHKGESIKDLAVELDYEIAINTINQVVEVLHPEFVIFISKFSWEKIGKRIIQKENIKYDFTYHPNSYGDWNDVTNPNSKKKFLELLK